MTQLQDEEQMLTLEDTDVAIKRAEQHLHRSDGAGAAVKDKVAFKADVSDAEDPDDINTAFAHAGLQADTYAI